MLLPILNSRLELVQPIDLFIKPEIIAASDSSLCNAILTSKPAVPYIANRFKLSVPTTYFQGTWDAATPPTGAIKHFKDVSKAFKQLVIAKRGGHCPNFYIMKHGTPVERRQQTMVFEKALKGEKLIQSDLVKTDSAGVEWILVPQAKP